MKIAKASKEEWEKAIKFVNELEDKKEDYRVSNKELGEWVRNSSPLFRVVFGYQVLVDNCCDPDLDYLEFKPEIQRAMEAMQLSSSKPLNDRTAENL